MPQPSYAPPVLRAPSPASSVGTAHHPDTTSLSDSEDTLSHDAFRRKWEEKIFGKTDYETEMEESMKPPWPLLVVRDPKDGEPVSLISKEEEKQMYDRCLTNLRDKITVLCEADSFEQSLFRRASQVGMTEQPSSNDIDVIMKSMMGCTTNELSSTEGVLSHAGGGNPGKGKGRSRS